MATFKMSIAEDTALWKSVGELSPKARNAEIYRLATTGLIAQSAGLVSAANGVVLDVASANPVPEKHVAQAEQMVNEKPPVPQEGDFVTVDFGEDLMFLSGN